jgi:hypothetical protein
LLNLPPQICNKVSHLCLAGITPGPFLPDTETINHLLKPFFDKLIQLESGVQIETYPYPRARTVKIKLLCLLGDSLAVKKVAGFASHLATYFCTWSKHTLKDLELLKCGSHRTKQENLMEARSAKDAKSINKSAELLKLSGTRWSELNRLSYWGFHESCILGVMHNWLEGVLQGHF